MTVAQFESLTSSYRDPVELLTPSIVTQFEALYPSKCDPF